jgi:hypothetical protein
MVFQAGQRDPCTWDVARLSYSVKIHSPAARVFLHFPKVSRHPSCMDHAILHGNTIYTLFSSVKDVMSTSRYNSTRFGLFTSVWQKHSYYYLRILFKYIEKKCGLTNNFFLAGQMNHGLQSLFLELPKWSDSCRYMKGKFLVIFLDY